MARKNAIVSVAIDSSVITFTVAEVGDIVIDVTKLAEEITERATYHGLVQKISDAAALGKDATPSDKFAAMKSVADRLIDGEWKQSRGEGAGPVAGIIFRAFSQWVADRAKLAKKPMPAVEAIRAVYDGKTRAEQLALRNVAEIAAIIETLKAAKTPKQGVDTDALLGDLGL
jgi:hypothetical protein